jgi:hypothetical protein
MNVIVFICLQCVLISVALASSSMPECCQYLEEPVDLIHCVTTTSSSVVKDNDSPSKVTFVAFASESIYNYASLTLLINSVYAESHDYSIKFLSGENSASDFYPEDKRWNKIGSVIEALNPENGWARNVDVIVPIDVDLIIMDQSLDIEKILSSYPKAHILMSADPSDVGNTGFIIVRNTKWAYQFFQTWWETRFSFDCDQHALNDLYSKLLETKKSKNKVAILPGGDINSEFPVYSTFDDNSKVLHMVGEHNEIRYEVFSRAAHGLCGDFLSEDDEEEEEEDEDGFADSTGESSNANLGGYGLSRFGLTRAVIADAAEGHISVLLDRQFRECSGLIYAAPPDGSLRRKGQEAADTVVKEIDDCMQKLHAVSTQLCGFGRGIMAGREQRCIELYDENYKLAEKGSKLVPLAHISLVDHMTKNLYDAFIIGQASEESIKRGEKVESFSNG